MTIEPTKVREIVRPDLGREVGVAWGPLIEMATQHWWRDGQCWDNGVGSNMHTSSKSRPAVGELCGKGLSEVSEIEEEQYARAISDQEMRMALGLDLAR